MRQRWKRRKDQTMLKPGYAGALKLQLTTEQLAVFTTQAKVLNSAREAGTPVVSPNQVVIRYALLGLHQFGSAEAQAAMEIAASKPVGEKASSGLSPEQKAAAKAQKTAEKLAEKAAAAMEKASALKKAAADAQILVAASAAVTPEETSDTPSVMELESELVA